MKQNHLHLPSYYLSNKKKENSSSGPNSLRNSNNDSSESSDSLTIFSSDNDLNCKKNLHQFHINSI